MRTRYDQLGKQMLRAGLEGRGTFYTEFEVSPEPQAADGYFEPNLSRPSPVDGTLLGRMTERRCSLEVSSLPPDAVEMEGCVRKLMNLRHILRKTMEEKALPVQWLISSGKPSTALEAARACAKENWPVGVYELPTLLATSVIVLSELPEDQSTLLLRLMGRGRTLRRAIAELKTLPEEAFEKCIALPLLVRFRFEVVKAPVLEVEEEEEFLMDTHETYEMWEQRVTQSAELRGELRGECKAVLRLLRRKFGELSEDMVARVQNADALMLEQLEDKVLFAKSLDEVFAS